MRPVNLLPPELRPRIPGEGDPRLAWGVLGVLAFLLVMIVVSISFSNKAKTLNDEAIAMQAEAQKRQAAVAVVPTKPDDVTAQVKSRTLLVGGLSAVRFPWNVSMRDLSKSLPPDVTLDSILAVSAAPIDASQTASAPAGGATMQPQLTLGGCASGWVGYSRLMTWLRQMPGVESVKSASSSVEATKTESSTAEGEEEDVNTARSKNCGPAPLRFSLNVHYRPKSADLLGLPRPQAAAGATGATGGTTAPTTGTPAAAATGG